MKPATLLRILGVAFLAATLALPSIPQTAHPAPSAILFNNVRVFNGTAQLSARQNVLVAGGTITKISSTAIPAPDSTTLTTIDGAGRTLMPGLIDA
jgi:imidazolonepropionase-like amidohydrolase